MERRLSYQNVYEETYDPDLARFLRGEMDEPEERVSREGVPQYLPEERIARRVSNIWETSKPKIVLRARMQVKLKNFGYLPVTGDQIRLLRIKPGKREEPLECDLAIKSLAEVKGGYEALSYCWGRGDPTEIVRIRKVFPHTPSTGGSLKPTRYSYGQPKDFPVRPGLYDALRHLRDQQKTIVIWVDAICIDQSETAEARREKEQQLSMMNVIYNSAKNVCIWLGEQSDKSTDAFEFVREIMNFRKFDAYFEGDSQKAKTRWCNLIDALTAPWFGRRWIIQEVASARQASVHCGDDIVHWDDLADAISLLNEKADVLKQKYNDEPFAEIPILSATHLVKAIGNVCRKAEDGEVVEKLLDLETLVSTFQQFQATYAEDIIHSVRSLAKDAPEQNEDEVFRTTVEQEKSTRDLFIAFVNRCIKTSRSLDIICRHWAPPPTDTAGEEIKLPSWVSDLSKSPFGLPGKSRERENGENFVAMTPNDSRKRYNASSGYHAFYGQDRTYYSSIVPAIRIAPPGSDPQSFLGVQGHNITDGEIILSPLAIEQKDPFSNPARSSLAKPRSGLGSKRSRASSLSSFPSLVNHIIDGGHHQTVKNNNNAKLNSISENSAEGNKDFGHLSSPEPPFHTTAPTGYTKPNPTPKRPRANSGATAATPGSSQDMSPAGSQSIPSPTKRMRKGSTSTERRYTQTDEQHRKHLPGILRVRGFVLGTIKRHSDVMRDGIVPGDWLRILGWDRNSEKNRVPDIIWRMLVADRTPEGGKPPGWYQRACLHSLRDSRISSGRGDLRSSRTTQSAEMTTKYLRRVESVVWNRRIVEMNSEFCGTDRLFGLAPEGTEARDIICILFGCSVPVVLRRIDAHVGSSELFELVGEAYVHGKMDGEAVQDEEKVNKMSSSAISIEQKLARASEEIKEGRKWRAIGLWRQAITIVDQDPDLDPRYSLDVRDRIAALFLSVGHYAEASRLDNEIEEILDEIDRDGLLEDFVEEIRINIQRRRKEEE